MFTYPLAIPCYKNGVWSPFIVRDQEAHIDLVKSNMKIPGDYNLDETSNFWISAAKKFETTGSYTDFIPDTSQYIKHWTLEKNKVLNGVIIEDRYVPPFYYWYLNYCVILNRKKRTESFPSIYDSDYHFFLYILLCILLGKHACIVKTRQRGYSYKITAILLWSYWWFKGSINTIGASDEDYTLKSWEYMTIYRNHLNEHTAWIRGPYIPKVLDWTERNTTDDGRTIGLNSKLKGLTFKQKPTKGVGGAQSFFFYEEAGIAPTLLETIGYIRPAVELGNITTGTIIISGSVGDLDDCQDLKKIFESPDSYNFLGIKNIFEENTSHETIGFFVPETWSLEGFMDSFGNSQVDEAREFILQKRRHAEQNQSAEDYQLAVSQTPLTPSEAFHTRKRSFFPAHLCNKQSERLSINKPSLTPVILFEKENREIGWRRASLDGDPKPIHKYPLTDKDKDIRGCVEIEEWPEENSKFLTYFAVVDPISTDQTTTSESLFSVTIFKNLLETKTEDPETGEVKMKITGFKPVAWYTGRMSDLKETNQIGEFLIRFYNAFAIIESNVQTFINHMQSRNLQGLMATKKDIGFLEDLNANQNVHKTYGVHMTPVIKNYIFQNIKDYMLEELEIIRKTTGEPIRTVYGIERLNDVALLSEAKSWRDGLNTDRLISFGLALSLAKHYIVNGLFDRVDKTTSKKEVIVQAPAKSLFKTLDSHLNPNYIRPRQYFKNYG